MELDIKICGRDKEIREIFQFLKVRIESKKSGILYVTGPPGTGKSMSIRYVLDQIKSNYTSVPQLHLNCFKEQSSKTMLTKITRFVDLHKTTHKCNESETISKLTKKFTSKTTTTHIIVLDEMDQLPKSKTNDLIRIIYSWPNQPNCKLIIVGIANTVNLTSRYQIINTIVGVDQDNLTKVIYRPYSSKDIRAILDWYIENDENFEDAELEPKALDLISVRYARENGDIRAALNALKSAIDDSVKRVVVKISNEKTTEYPTPPATPPLSPRKNKTNIASVANSIRKRQKTTDYLEDKFPFMHQIILTCIYKLSHNTKGSSCETKTCKKLAILALQKYGFTFSSDDDYQQILDLLEAQGFIRFRRSISSNRIILIATETELSTLLERRDMILESIAALPSR